MVRQGNAVLLGEVDVGLSMIADYFGGGNELQALFSFPLNRFTMLGPAQQNADAIKFGLDQLPTIPDAGQWVNSLRHHDELNLSQLTKEQRGEIVDAFAPRPGMRIYNRGPRRRLAPMFDGNLARLRMAYSLLFGLPGAPMIFYGEEIGMGENLRIPGRYSVRTPMQWTAHNHGGFSTVATRDFVRPMPGGEYGPDTVNVGAQRSHPDALLNFMASLMRTRRECSEIGSGSSTALELGTDHVLGLRHDAEDSAIIVINNLSDQPQDIMVSSLTTSAGLSPSC